MFRSCHFDLITFFPTAKVLSTAVCSNLVSVIAGVDKGWGRRDPASTAANAVPPSSPIRCSDRFGARQIRSSPNPQAICLPEDQSEGTPLPHWGRMVLWHLL